MSPEDGIDIAQWLRAADGRPVVADTWDGVLEGCDPEVAIDVIVDHYRASSRPLAASELFSMTFARQAANATEQLIRTTNPTHEENRHG